MLSGCAKKQDSLLAKSDTNGTVELDKSVGVAPKEVNKTIKRTNITINSYSDCPSFTNSDYKTIPYE